MKRIFLIAVLMISIASMAQEIKTNTPNPFCAAKYANDVIIKSDPNIDQRGVKLAVAFNGWLYAAYSTDSIGSKVE